MSPENLNLSTQETSSESFSKSFGTDPLTVAEIIGKDDPVELKKLDEKYSIVQTSDKKIEGTKSGELAVVNNEELSHNFPGSTIIKKIDGTYFAVRKNKNDEWEGNSFTLMPDGNIGAVYQEHNIDDDVIEMAEKKFEFTIPLLNRDLMKLGVDREKRIEFLDELKSFPSEKIIDLYHGLNGGIDGALKVLESQEQGIKQISGPCLSVYPIGQFWKPGSAGFRYSISRGDIEFPGESKPNAQFRMDDEGVIFLVNGLDTLSLTKFDGEVVRNVATREVYEKDEDGFNKANLINGEWKDLPPVEKVVHLTDEEMALEKKIKEKLKELSSIRKTNSHQ